MLHFGNPLEITSEISGKVWEFAVPTTYAESCTAKFNVSNLRNQENGTTVLRVISDTAPASVALQVQPNLEDLYLYYADERQPLK